jgi:signal transduction histidine kinase
VTFDAYPLVSQVLREKRALLVTDTRENTSWKRGQHPEFEVRSWMGVPLIARDRVSGLINIDNFTPFSFSVEDLQIIQVFTHQIAAAIENFRLLEEASHQNQALQAINTVLAASSEALPQENRLQVTLERVLETLKLEGGAIHQFNPERGEYRLRAVSGLSPEIEAKIQTVKGGSEMPTICLPDCDPCFFFSVPLLSHGTQLGVLSVCQAEGLVPATTHRLLGHIGQQLGVMMDNAILFENTMRREALSTDLGRLSLAISAQLDRDTVLNLICRESTAVFNAQGAYLWLIDGTDDLVGTAAYGPGASEFKKSRCNLSNPEQIPASVIHEWRPKYVNHVAYTAMLPDDLLRLTHAQSVIAVPLLKADIPIGALMLVNTEEPDAFSDWLLEQIGLLGVQAALAIQNVSLFDEIRRRLDQLRLVNEVGRYATAILSLQNLIEGVAYKLSDILRYDVISLLQVENNELYVHSVFVRNRLITPQERYLPLEGQLGQAVRRAEPILQNRHAQIEHDFKDLPTEFDCCSLAVPLIIADEVIGVLRVERIGDNTITQDDLDVLEPLAAQLAVSVSNARLFEKVRQQTLELEGRVAERTAEIRQQQERTDAVLSSVADAVIVFDLSEQVIMKNPVANLLYERYDLEMNLGDRIGALIARTLDADPDAGSTTEIIELGPVTLQAKAARLLESDHVTGSVVTLRDISRLQELDRMKDKFVSNVSHELRTPLANLKLYMSLLHSGRPERRDNYMEVMSREVERLNRLIGDLLDLSRLQSEQRSSRTPIRQPINTGEIIETVVQNNMAWAESKHNELMHECDYLPLPWILGDPDQILRAITNLVANAINYTLDGGKIWVRSRVELAEHEKPEWVIIEVTDTGIGIPAAELPDIFQRFYRGSNVNPSIPGTGLGLAIIKEIVDLHGGTIDIESEEGRGSTFRLRLPVLDLNKD